MAAGRHGLIDALHTYTHTRRKIMSCSKNKTSGYELRNDLLGMAIGILESRNARQFENEHLKPEGQRTAVDPYTTEDVLVEAEKLYRFVQKK